MGLMISKEPVIETDRLILRPITLDEQAKELGVVLEIVNIEGV